MRLFIVSITLLLISILVSCKNQESANCFIHYTSDTLDVKSLKFRQVIQNSALIPKTDEQIDSVFNLNASLSYEEYGGAIPKFSKEFNLDTLIDENGWRTMKLTRKGQTPEFNIMFIHGGAFYMNFSPNHTQFCEVLLNKLNAAIYMPLYPLAPNHKVIEGTNMLLGVYKILLEDGKPIYIMGDSAGGNLTLCLTLYLKEIDMKLPDAIFPISPVVDMTYENPELKEIASRDPMLTLGGLVIGRQWVEEGMSYKDPRVSPIFGDLKGMPKTLFFIGSDDMSCPDQMLMYEKMKAAGIEVGLLYGKSLWHTAPIFPIPVQDQYIGEIINFIK